MSYIGSVPAANYKIVRKQTITGNGGTTYTLDYSVGNEQEIEVYVNNVRQEPAVAYTVTGNSLTMMGTVASTDTFYVIFQGKAEQTIGIPEKQSNGTYVFASSTVIGGNATVSGTLAVTGNTTISGILSTANASLTNPTISSNLTFGTAVASTPSGSAPLAFCRAWVSFNGTGTSSIRASYNVTSITDNGTGDYTVNFTTAMSDANYCCLVTSDYGSSTLFNITAPTTTAARVSGYSTTTGAYRASAWMMVAIFR